MGMSVVANTPSIGFIQWSNVSISYKGSTFNITNGNTDKIYTYWLYSTPTVFNVSDTYPTLGDDDILVFVNKFGAPLTVPNTTVLDGSLVVPESITARAIAADTITALQIAANTITSNEILAGTILALNIKAGTITGNEIAANSIAGDRIVANSILGDRIAANTIIASHISSLNGLNVGNGNFVIDSSGNVSMKGTLSGSSFNITPHTNAQGRTESLVIDTNGYYNKDAASALSTAQNNVVMLNSGAMYLQDNTGMSINTQLKIGQTGLSFDSFLGTTPVALQNQDIRFDQAKGIVLGVNNVDDFIIGEMYISINKPINTTIRIDGSSRQLQFAQGGVDKWHIESVSNGDIFKIVETSVSQRLLLNAGTTLPQVELNGDGSFLRFNASNNSFMEYYLSGVRQGWIGYGTGGSTLMTMRNEQGDISITPKVTTNKINLNGDTYIPNGVGLTLGTANSANTANQLVIYNTGDAIVLQSGNNADAYNSSNIVWKTSGGTMIGRIHVYGTAYSNTSMIFEVTDETGVLNPNPMLELNAAGTNWSKFDSDVYPAGDNNRNLGTTSLRWKQLYAGTTVIATSDEKTKQQISLVPDAILDAWSEVDYVQFKFNDAVAEKGESKARWHIGIIAQSIEKAFKKHGLDAFKIGILCYDEWTDDDGISHNLYGIRPDECQFLEMALMRRELKLLKGVN